MYFNTYFNVYIKSLEEINGLNKAGFGLRIGMRCCSLDRISLMDLRRHSKWNV